MTELDPRAELASIAASLRAYLEWQTDCGSSGIPRLPRAQRPVRAEAPVAAPPPASKLEELPPVTIPASMPGSVLPPPVPSLVVPRPMPILQKDVAECKQCRLHETRANTVFSRGNPEAKLVFVGEAPGADEDASGIPFVGRAGQLLDRMIVAMGLDPEKDVYVCNIIKCRPPGNRKPEPDEVATCIPYLHEQLAQIDPKAIVALGNTSVAALLGTKIGITKVRGAWKLYRGRTPVMPTYHPSYLLRPGPAQSEAKRQVWEDLQTVMKELGLTKS